MQVMKCENVILTIELTLKYENLLKRKIRRERRCGDKETQSFA